MTSDLKPKDCDNQKNRGEPYTRPNREEPAFVPPDGGWGWVVCIASLWVNGLVFGILNSYGIIYVPMLKIYGTNDPNISFKTCKYNVFFFFIILNIILFHLDDLFLSYLYLSWLCNENTEQG